MIFYYNHIKPLNRVNQLIQSQYPYVAFIQYDDIVDCYLLQDIDNHTINELAYYMLISFDIRLIDNNTLKIISLLDNRLINQSCIYDTCNSFINTIINNPSINL
jgi:hypothetical protein